ncbi:hypothetical protein GCM10007962_32710 [Yeosuana aromativorans]|uniref:Uncharacterized protein n=1 Tax=Yeosuana aromativorans TaxID=288019 RepID=A0A8J3FJA2_9FLAO|nr:hypothetical protein [Yeosuana aromativorans]GGK35826.1 hypothetical protein GCM10007962_32710 [Yeosuana aromativorans]
MIQTPEEFIRLRTSEDLNDQRTSATDSADIKTWLEIIENYPEMKEWVAHNKTVPLEILEVLATDKDEKVRCVVARKRKINNRIFDLLKADSDKTVRHALICNTGLALDLKKKIKIDDSGWLKNELNEK